MFPDLYWYTQTSKQKSSFPLSDSSCENWEESCGWGILGSPSASAGQPGSFCRVRAALPFLDPTRHCRRPPHLLGEALPRLCPTSPTFLQVKTSQWLQGAVCSEGRGTWRQSAIKTRAFKTLRSLGERGPVTHNATRRAELCRGDFDCCVLSAGPRSAKGWRKDGGRGDDAEPFPGMSNPGRLLWLRRNRLREWLLL